MRGHESEFVELVVLVEPGPLADAGRAAAGHLGVIVGGRDMLVSVESWGPTGKTWSGLLAASAFRRIPENWMSLGRSASAAMGRQLAKEVGRRHKLRGRSLIAFAKSEANDDVAYLEVNTGVVVVVHLTWSAETSPGWPAFEEFSNTIEFVEQLWLEY